jgi:hypothetical protein
VAPDIFLRKAEGGNLKPERRREEGRRILVSPLSDSGFRFPPSSLILHPLSFTP